jgi:hypothetical protein
MRSEQARSVERKSTDHQKASDCSRGQLPLEDYAVVQCAVPEYTVAQCAVAEYTVTQCATPDYTITQCA